MMLILPLITSYANGCVLTLRVIESKPMSYLRFDGSMMNSLQSVSNWQDYFGHPVGGKLGLFNAIQNVSSRVKLLLRAGADHHSDWCSVRCLLRTVRVGYLRS